jgi:hypothetical protein
VGIRHVSVLTWREGTPVASIAAVSDALATLPAQIPELRDYRFGPDLGLAADNCDFVVVADFASVEGYLAYRDHPAHQAVLADVIRPILAARSAVQYTI